ncbi:MptD family putative ECF transporter S component, partial [Streptococcus suis]
MKQLTVKDMILTGALSALYCIGVGLGTLLAVLIFRSANMVEAPAVAALICGVVYMLLIAKVQKFGAVLLMGAIMAVFFFLSGHFILSFFPSLICGFLADLLARFGNYMSQWRNLWS